MLYRNCFVGIDLTTWLQQNFSDLDSREQAVELGGRLMEAGLFVHVRGRHGFKDGIFFYQIAKPFMLNNADSRKSWFGRGSNAPDPEAQHSQHSQHVSHRSTSPGRAHFEDNEGMGPLQSIKRKKRILLSSSFLYDVDHRRRSDRPELIRLHYDRISSADECYHIRVDWANASPRWIQDSLDSWSSLVERFGLHLVQVPICEAYAILACLPFADSYMINSANIATEGIAPGTAGAGSVPREKHIRKYHESILRRSGFVLDFEAAEDFPNDMDVMYSWGSLHYRASQFVSRDGQILAQAEIGDKCLLVNPLMRTSGTIKMATSKGNQARQAGRTIHQTATQSESLSRGPLDGNWAPSSQTLQAAQPAMTNAWMTPLPPPVAELQRICSSNDVLQALYDEVTGADDNSTSAGLTTREHS